nr:MAG TPA: hypothetical protein [Caudoviricetes sp.]
MALISIVWKMFISGRIQESTGSFGGPLMARESRQ